MDYFWVQITGRTDYPMPVIETRYAALAPIIDFIQEFLSGNGKGRCR